MKRWIWADGYPKSSGHIHWSTVESEPRAVKTVDEDSALTVLPQRDAPRFTLPSIGSGKMD
jgi:hypothetical protein